jgi:hypothetical protein
MPWQVPLVAASVMRMHPLCAKVSGADRRLFTALFTLLTREIVCARVATHTDPRCRLKTRIQADAGHGRSVRALIMRILKEEGIAGFYRGFGATMLNTFSMRTPLSLPCLAIRLNHPTQNTPISSSTPSCARRT